MLSALIHSRLSYPAGAFGKTAGRPEVSSLRSSRHVIGLSQKLVKSNPLFLGAQTISSPSLNEVGCWRVTYMCLSSMLSSTFRHHISPSCKSRNESLRGQTNNFKQFRACFLAFRDIVFFLYREYAINNFSFLLYRKRTKGCGRQYLCCFDKHHGLSFFELEVRKQCCKDVVYLGESVYTNFAHAIISFGNIPNT